MVFSGSSRVSNRLSVRQLELKSIQYRKTILSIIRQAGGGHTAGSLSCTDLLNVLYNRVMDITPDNFGSIARDHYIQSKGHSVEALYTVLADVGFFPAKELATLGRAGSHFVGHPTRKVPGIEHNTGALGHGLAIAVGLALGLKQDGLPHRVYTLLGDGELAEGSNWEASMTASHYALDNLVVIVDRNDLQITGFTEDVMALEPLADKFRAFGYAVQEVNGNAIPDLVEHLERAPFEPGKPNLLLAHTVKGRGVSFMENVALWHHHVPSEDELHQAIQELNQAEAHLMGVPE
ncbi:MAG: transketolase [Caldilineaceae bacterium]|nr:transketolase [Caldilineaceae bacterium]